jgi:hypothetical protein
VLTYSEKIPKDKDFLIAAPISSKQSGSGCEGIMYYLCIIREGSLGALAIKSYAGGGYFLCFDFMGDLA